MANGAFKFKDSYGNTVSFISGSGSNIVISGGTLDLSGMTGLTLGNITMSGTTQNATSASHAASYLLTSSFNTYSGNTNTIIGTLATTGSNLFKGDQTFSGSLIPSTNALYDLGDPTHHFRHLYLSSASLYIDGKKVLGSTSQELQFTTDTGQSFKILEDGSDNITLQSADGNIELKSSGGGDVIMDPTTGVIALKGTTTLYAGNKLLSSDGNAIQVGNSLTVTGSMIVTGYIETQELRTTYISSSILYRSGSTKFGDELGDTHSFTGSLSVSGSISVPGSNLVSGSAQILNGSGIWSGSAQLPSGTISGSVQVDVMSTTNIARLATTGSNSFTSNQIVTGSITNRGVVIDGANNSNVAKLNFTRTDNSWGIHNETNLRIYVGSGNTTSPGTQVVELTTAGAATFSNTLQANGKIYLQRASNGADTLLQFKNEIGADRAYIKFGGTAEELAFYAGAGGTRNMIIGSDGAMGFNYSTLAVRSFMFRALVDRPLAIEVTESGGVHSLYLRPNSSGRHLITSNYLSGGVYLPLSLSGRENDADFVLNNGNTGIGVTSPGYKLDVQTSSGGVFGSTYTGAWSSGYLNHSSFMATSLTGGAVSLAIGVANSSYNVGKVVFNYSGNGDTGNSLGLGFWDNDNVLRVFANNKVYIGGPTNPGNGLSLPGPIQAGRSNVNFLDPGSTGNVLGGTTFFVPSSYDSSNNGYVRISQDSSTISFTTDWDGHIAGGTLKTIIFKHGQVGNGVQLTNGATSWSSYTSDARTKTIHRTIENTGLETISKLNGVVYTMSKIDEKYGADTKLKIGFTAQNVQDAIPEAVFVSYQDDELGDVLTYTPDYIIPYLVESIKELKSENDSLKLRIEQLENN